jgi:hypothetical protein
MSHPRGRTAGAFRRGAMFAAPAAALIVGAGGVAVHAAPLIGTTTIYVATTGSDSNPCTKAKPCATLQFAVDNSPGGGIIKVEAGTYHQTVNITKPLTLQGAGASSTILDGTNIDTEAMPTPYFGVISVENNPGAGGPITIKGFTVENAYITPAEYALDADPTDVIVYADANAADTVHVSGMALRAVQNADQFAGVGFDTFNAAAAVSFTNSSVTGTFQGALLEGGGIGGSVSVTHVNFHALTDCSATACGSVHPAEGLFVLSDQPGTANDTIGDNTFQGYAGLGLAANAGYAGGNCSGSNGPCSGNTNLTGNGNHFALAACGSAADGCDAIVLDALSGNELTAHLQGNKGTVHSPDGAIVEEADGGVYNVTEINNRIHVTP